MSGISKSQVSRLCEEIDVRVKAFLDREPNGSALRHIRNRQGPSRVDRLRKATLDDAEARLAPPARTSE